MAAVRAKETTAGSHPSSLLKMSSLTLSQVSDRSYWLLQTTVIKPIFEIQWATENKGKHFVGEDFCNMKSSIAFFFGNWECIKWQPGSCHATLITCICHRLEFYAWMRKHERVLTCKNEGLMWCSSGLVVAGSAFVLYPTVRAKKFLSMKMTKPRCCCD